MRKFLAGLKILVVISSLGCVFAHADSLSLEAKITDAADGLAERPSLFIRCQLRYAMDCETLRRAFFDRLKVLDRVDNDTALIKVLLTDESTPGGTLVHSKWSSREDLSVVDFPLPNLLLPPQYDTAKRQSALITLLSQGVLLHVQVKSGAGLEEVVVKSLLDPNAPTAETTDPFYAEVNLSGQTSKSGMGARNTDGTPGSATSNSYVYGWVDLNHSTERTRLWGSASISYSQKTQPGDNGTSLSAENLDKYVNVLAVYSLNKKQRWNVAILAAQSEEPGSNLRRSRDVGAGLEFNLVPFRVDQPYEFRVNSTVYRRFDRLILPNDRGNTDEDYYAVILKVAAYWLLLNDKASLDGSVKGRRNLSHAGYYSMDASVNFNYQITGGIRLRSGASYGFIKKNLRFPATPDYSNPLQTQFQSGYAGGNFSTSVGLTFTFGKGGTLSTRDRRFQ